MLTELAERGASDLAVGGDEEVADQGGGEEALGSDAGIGLEPRRQGRLREGDSL